MSVFETLGVLYVILSTVSFTCAWLVLVLIGLKEAKRRYWRGKIEEFRDLQEQSSFRDMARTGR